MSDTTERTARLAELRKFADRVWDEVGNVPDEVWTAPTGAAAKPCPHDYEDHNCPYCTDKSRASGRFAAVLAELRMHWPTTGLPKQRAALVDVLYDTALEMVRANPALALDRLLDDSIRPERTS